MKKDIKGKYFKLPDKTASIHILEVEDGVVTYERGWYDINEYGISAKTGKISSNLDKEEPFCYDGGWVGILKDTYEETDRETFTEIYNKSMKIEKDLEELKKKWKP